MRLTFWFIGFLCGIAATVAALAITVWAVTW